MTGHQQPAEFHGHGQIQFVLINWKPQPQSRPAGPDLDELPAFQPGILAGPATIDLMSDLAAQNPTDNIGCHRIPVPPAVNGNQAWNDWQAGVEMQSHQIFSHMSHYPTISVPID